MLVFVRNWLSISTAADRSPASSGILVRTWKVPVSPGRRASARGLTSPKLVYLVVVNRYSTLPWKPAGLAEAKNTAGQVPGAGDRTSTCPWVPAPCRSEGGPYSAVGPVSARPARGP